MHYIFYSTQIVASIFSFIMCTILLYVADSFWMVLVSLLIVTWATWTQINCWLSGDSVEEKAAEE